MKRILICGANGLLGQRLSLMLQSRIDHEVLCTSRQRSFAVPTSLVDYTLLDITRKSDVRSLVSSYQPTDIINAAAEANVDWCETNREEAWNINVLAVGNLADAARKVGARVAHVSTDYVFDGRSGPYDETTKPNPLSYYGKSKLAGENLLIGSGVPCAIVRTIVIYGTGAGVRDNFALWVYHNLSQGKRIRCAEDQISNPTYVGDLSGALLRIIEHERSGIYHVAGGSVVSRLAFALAVAEVFGLDTSLIERVRNADLEQAAPRPLRTEFINLHAQTDLGYKPLTIVEGLQSMKRDMRTLH